MSADIVQSNTVLSDLLFACFNTGKRVIYTHRTHIYHCMPETVEHRNIRCKTKSLAKDKTEIHNETVKKHNSSVEFIHIDRKPQVFHCQKTDLPSFLFSVMPKVFKNKNIQLNRYYIYMIFR